MSDVRIAKHLLIAGRVQGVWYRGAMHREAERLGLGGWVKNLPDGRVEAVVEGPEGRVLEIVRWCATGPPSARVSEVVAHDEPTTGRRSFDVRY